MAILPIVRDKESSMYFYAEHTQHADDNIRNSSVSEVNYADIFWGVELTFASSLIGLLSHLQSNICTTQDKSFTGLGEKFQGEKTSI